MGLRTIPIAFKMIVHIFLEGTHLQELFDESYHMEHTVIKCQLQMTCSAKTTNLFSKDPPNLQKI